MAGNVDTVIAKYGQRPPKKAKRWSPVVLGLTILFVSAGIVTGVLIWANGSLMVKNLQSSSKMAMLSPKDSINKILATTTIAQLKNYTLFRTNIAQTDTDPSATTIAFQESGYSFLTNVPADDGIRFTILNPSEGSHKDAIASAIKTSLTSVGFTETDQDTSMLSNYATTSYTNGSTICQVINFSNSKNSILQQAVLCATGTTHKAAYQEVTSLLNAVDPAITRSAKTIKQSTVSDIMTGTKKLLTLTVQPNSVHGVTDYYFATLSNQYEYLGSHTEGTSSFSDELDKNIANPKWGTFLKDVLKQPMDSQK